MPQVTGGQVVYGRTVQPAQYESKKAEVTLTFGIEDTTPADKAAEFISEVATQAINQAHAMVGLATTLTANAPKKPAAKGAATKEVAAQKMNEKDAAKPKPGADDLGLDDVKPAISTGGEPAQKDLDGLDLEGGAQPITDTMLQEAVQAKMKEINDGKRIKAVREKYVPVPKAIKDIPQDKRAEFLADIKALVKE